MIFNLPLQLQRFAMHGLHAQLWKFASVPSLAQTVTSSRIFVAWTAGCSRISSSPRIRGRSVSVVELIFHTATVIVMGCAASVEPKAALPPVQRYNFVGPEIGRSSSMLDSAESREICPFGCRSLKLNVDVSIRNHLITF